MHARESHENALKIEEDERVLDTDLCAPHLLHESDGLGVVILCQALQRSLVASVDGAVLAGLAV